MDQKEAFRSAAIVGRDALSKTTVDFILSKPGLDIAEYIGSIREALEENGVQLDDMQIDRIFEQIEVLETMREDRKAEEEQALRREQNNPYLAEAEEVETYVPDGARHTRGKASGVALEIRMNGVTNHESVNRSEKVRKAS